MELRGKDLKPYRSCHIKKDWEAGAFGKPVEGSLTYYAYGKGVGLICKFDSLIKVKKFLDIVLKDVDKKAQLDSIDLSGILTADRCKDALNSLYGYKEGNAVGG